MCTHDEWQRIKAQKAKERAARKLKEDARQQRAEKREALRKSLLKAIQQIDISGRVMKPHQLRRFRQQLNIKYPPRRYPA